MSEETQRVFPIPPDELEKIDALIAQKMNAQINEHSTLQAILRIAKTPEEAMMMVDYLTTIDWHQEFRQQEQEKQENLRYRMERLHRSLQNGAGICDWCKQFQDKLYGWPHNSYPPRGGRWEKDEIGALKRYCWKCLYDVQEIIEELLKEEWAAKGIVAPKGHILRWRNRLDQCPLCKRLVPWGSLIPVAQRSSYRSRTSVCLHCVEIAAEKQFSYCAECGKKTANGLSGNVCYDCKVDSPYHWQVSTHLSRARSAGTPATLTLREWAATVEYFGSTCAYCRHRPFEVLEHFLPISRGGGTTFDNCVPACSACNRKKGRRHPDTLCVNVSLFGPLFSPHADFLPEHIEYIRQYLQREHPPTTPRSSKERALVVYSIE